MVYASQIQMKRKRELKSSNDGNHFYQQTRLTPSVFLGKKPLVAPSNLLVTCPICDTTISESIINLHVDACIVRKEKLSSKLEYVSTCDEVRIIDSENEGTKTISENEVIEKSPIIDGLLFINNFVSNEEAESIITLLDNHQTPWHNSKFNGFCLSKTFGYKTQFGVPGEERCVRVNDPKSGEMPIPDFLANFPKRLAHIISTSSLDFIPQTLRSFKANECNANSYLQDAGHYLTAHFDDRSLSGPVLMNLSLGCDSYMTYHAGDGVEHNVFLPRNCLQLVTGKARYDYQHSLKAESVLGARRVSVTWRQAGLAKGGVSKVVGEKPRGSFCFSTISKS